MNVNDYTKSSKLNLYNESDLSEKNLYIECNNYGVLFDIETKLDINVPIISFNNQSLPEYDINDVSKYLYDENQNKISEIARVDGRITDNERNLNGEIVNRISQGVTITNNVEAYNNRAVSEENKIRTEITEKINQVNTSISNETTARINADTVNFDTLNSKIQTEKNTRIDDINNVNNRIDTLLDGTDVDLDQLQEIVTYFKNADTDILQTIAGLMSRLSFVEEKLGYLTNSVI